MAFTQIGRTLAATALVAAGIVGSANAQQSTPPAQGNIEWLPAEWQKTCSGSGQNEVCITSLEQFARLAGSDQPAPIAAAAIRQQVARPQVRFFLVRTPLQVRLRDGIFFSIDGSPATKMEYESCLNIGCVASVPATDQLIAGMKRGANMRVEFTGPDGKRLQVGITLAGFTAAIDGPAQPVNASSQSPSRPSKGDAPPQ